MTKPLKNLLALLAALIPATASLALDVPSPLVGVDWVARHEGDAALRIIDIRDAGAFGLGHIPGSVNGPYPAPWRDAQWRVLPVNQLAASFGTLGVSGNSAVVVAPAGGDSTEFGGATSVYWALRLVGHDNVTILDGGFSAWQAERPTDIAGGEAEVNATELDVGAAPDIRVQTGDVVAVLDDGGAVLIDARPPSQYLGESKSGLVARAGRIPGALNLPHTEVYDAGSGRLKSPEALARLLPAALADRDAPIIVYCNTGHWSSIVWFALHEVLGYTNARLYDGSMQAWADDPSRPVASGAP